MELLTLQVQSADIFKAFIGTWCEYFDECGIVSAKALYGFAHLHAIELNGRHEQSSEQLLEVTRRVAFEIVAQFLIKRKY